MIKKINHKKGFTLIELLVVIAIVALLASVAMVALNSARQDSRNTKRKADIKQIASALEIYFEDFNTYPWNRSAYYNEIDYDSWGYRWDSSCGDPDGSSDAFLTPLSSTGIMVNLPDDPNSVDETTCYIYSSNTVGNVYVNGYYLMAYLEGQVGDKACPGITFTNPQRFYTCLSQLP